MSNPIRPSTDLVPIATHEVVPLFDADRPRVPARIGDVVVNRHALPHTPHPDLVMLNAADGPRAATFRALRHRLVERGDPRTLLVTSAKPREGKTYVATNLALALAELRKHRVLLVDANARRPELARRFGLERGQHVCLLTQLEDHRERLDLPWHVTALGRCDLHLLAIALSTDRARTLDGPLFSGALERLALSYDYIVVDGAAVLEGPDVNLIEDAVGAILMTARAGHTRRGALKTAFEQISPTEVVGLTLVDDR